MVGFEEMLTDPIWFSALSWAGSEGPLLIQLVELSNRDLPLNQMFEVGVHPSILEIGNEVVHSSDSFLVFGTRRNLQPFSVDDSINDKCPVGGTVRTGL